MMLTKKKIVILGGGIGGLASAFGLTETSDWQNQYDITVYQLGWRLGGKGASGRNMHAQQRIEEHGLHVWMGFYENAFRLMRACYAELGRSSGSPLETWQDAFKPEPTTTWVEDLQTGWLDWNYTFPEYASQPGDGLPMPSLWEGIRRVVALMFQTLTESDLNKMQSTVGEHLNLVDIPEWIRGMIQETEGVVKTPANIYEVGTRIVLPPSILGAEVQWISYAHKLIQSCPNDPVQHRARYHQGIAWLLEKFTIRLHRVINDQQSKIDDRMRRFLVLCDLAIAEIKGILVDGILFHGFDSIDNWELSDWLRYHGASQQSIASAPLRGIYDCIVAYKNGDPSMPALAAGTGLRFIFRFLMWYKGALFWKMDAGMGDTVIAPLYQVLVKRGVKFKFFHRVKALELSVAKDSIKKIHIGRQVNLKNSEYDPLVNVKGLPCWPSEPLYNQIVEGDTLKAQGINLESAWTPWKDLDEVELQHGADFDLVILSTSFAPLKDICKELITANPKWKNMIEQIQTIQTQAVQLWLKPNLSSLGWVTSPTILTAYAHPLETWADMSQVLKWEEWPLDMKPGDVSYFCGPMSDVSVIPPYTDHNFPAQERERVRQYAISWLQQYIGHLWPNAKDGDAFNWELLVDPQNNRGIQRFMSQYWRANINPAERYVLSLPGTTQHRLKANESGFNNLYLSGDWVRNGLNIGCVESAVMGGLQTSRAICGFPQKITGETDNW